MAFALLKLSFNQPGEPTLTGGVCGTGFFMDNSTAVTAHHVLNESTFEPNIGFRHCCFWILSRSGAVVQLGRRFLQGYPEIDATALRFDRPQVGVAVYTLPSYEPEIGTKVCGVGHIGDVMPQVKARWEGQSIVITQADLESVICDKTGQIKRIAKLEVATRDVKLKNVAGYELSFGTNVGMSGGPLVGQQTGQALGLLSFGLPPDSYTKTQTFAVAMDEIRQCIRGGAT
jgi:hypothetical protein